MSRPSCSTTTNKKRKAATDLSGGVDEKRPPPALRKDSASAFSEEDGLHLPAPIWGHVLDYMPYQEVRSALLVGKVIANDAVRYVNALNFMRVHQMDGPAARRFPNVEEVNILCLVEYRENDQGLCRETANRTPLFLTNFPKLTRLFVGGYQQYGPIRMHVKERYVPEACDYPANHKQIFRGLVAQVMSGFKARLYPRSIEFTRAWATFWWDEVRECEPGQCLCRDICRYFAADILKQFVEEERLVCLDEKEMISVLKQRPETKAILKSFTGKRLVYYALNDAMWYHTIECLSLKERLEKAGVGKEDFLGVLYLTKRKLEEIDEVIQLGYDPYSIPKEILYKEFQIGAHGRRCDIFAKSTFEALVSRGFAFDEKDVIILDEQNEPALNGLVKKMNGLYG